MKYWVLEANIDGFRCDYADNLPLSFWKQALDELKAIEGRKLILVAEGGKAENFTAGFQINYAWNFYDQIVKVYSASAPQAASTIFTVHQAEYSAIPASASKLRFTTNHDKSAHEATPVQIFGGTKGALSASAITIFTSQVPLLYSSQEVGREENLSFFAKDPIDWTQNSTMQEQYQKFLSIYNGSDVFTKGTLNSFSNNDVAAFKRSFEDSEYLVIVNVRNSQRTFTLPAGLQNTSWTSALDDSSVSLGTSVSLQGYDYLILKK
jgi:glycosidase